MISDALKEFSNSVNERCADSGQADLDKQVIRFYKPDAVKAFGKELVLDRVEQAKQTGMVRAALAGLLGESQNFSNFNSKIGKEKFNSVLESTCERTAVEAHNNHVAANPERSRILGVSVVERLSREYAGNPEALRSYVISVVSRAKNYLCFNENEVKRQGPGTTQGGFVSYLSVILPEAPELGEFREQLRQEFRNATPGAKDEVTSRTKPNEITLVSLSNLFPARFVADVAFLKQRYESRTSGNDGPQAKMELHSEGDGSNFPSLFIEDADPKKYLAYLMMGRAAGMIQKLEDPDTGLLSIYLVTKNAKGRENDPELLGKDFQTVLEDASLSVYDAITSAVNQLLQSEYLHKTKREQLLANLEEQLAEVKAERKNPLDKVYKAHVQAVDYAETVLSPKQ
jgi:hypothetical protein